MFLDLMKMCPTFRGLTRDHDRLSSVRLVPALVVASGFTAENLRFGDLCKMVDCSSEQNTHGSYERSCLQHSIQILYATPPSSRWWDTMYGMWKSFFLQTEDEGHVVLIFL